MQTMRDDKTGYQDERPRRDRKPEIWLPPDAVPSNDVRDPNAGLPYPDKPRLIVFGGSFDPVHAGHINLARKVLEAGLGDEVIFIPAKQSPLKRPGQSQSGAARLEMLNLAIADALAEKPCYFLEDINGEQVRREYRFSVSDMELRRPGAKSYTIDTLELLRRIYPSHDIRLLIGTDLLKELGHWHRAGELVARYDLLIYPRPGSEHITYLELAAEYGDAMAARIFRGLLLHPTGGELPRPRPRKMRPNLPEPPQTAVPETPPPVPVAAAPSGAEGDFMDTGEAAAEAPAAPAAAPATASAETTPVAAPQVDVPQVDMPDAPPKAEERRPPLSRALKPEDFPLMDVSSTALRAAIAAGRVPDGLISPSVMAYIEKHGLYK